MPWERIQVRLPELLEEVGTEGACRHSQYPTSWFFSEHNPVLTEKAKRVCADCRVQEQCLAWAMKTGEQAGVWGGLTPEERKKMFNRHRKQIERSRQRTGT